MWRQKKCKFNLQNRDKVFTFAPLYYGKVGGLLAQLVEQWIENPCVPGSIPGETTKPPKFRRFFCLFHSNTAIYVFSDKLIYQYLSIFR